MNSPSTQKTAPRLGLIIVLAGVLLIVVTIGILSPMARRNDDLPGVEQPAATGKTVSLLVDFGQRELRLDAVAWHEGMTVLDALRGAVPIEHQGSGPSAFLMSIDGVKNEGRGTDAKSWIYYVNDQKGQEGIGVRRLEPGDRILWKFQVWE